MFLTNNRAVSVCLVSLTCLVLSHTCTGQTTHGQVYTRIDGFTVNSQCLPDSQMTAINKMACGMRCEQLAHPLQSCGFTYSMESQCYCRPIPSGVEPTPAFGAYMPGSTGNIPDLYFDMECIIDGQLLGSVDGLLVGNVELAAGKIGQALYTDGISQYVNLGNHRDKCVANRDLCPDGLTLTLWLKTGNTGNNEQYYLSNGGQTVGSHGITLLKVGGKLNARFRMLDGSDWWVKDPQVLVDGTWHHVMMTWSLAVGAKLYVDEQLVDELESPTPTGANAAHNEFYIGCPNNVFMEYGMAWYDDLRVYYEYKDSEFIELSYP